MVKTPDVGQERRAVKAMRAPSGAQLGSAPEPRIFTSWPSASPTSTRQAPVPAHGAKSSLLPSGDQRGRPLYAGSERVMRTTFVPSRLETVSATPSLVLRQNATLSPRGDQAASAPWIPSGRTSPPSAPTT